MATAGNNNNPATNDQRRGNFGDKGAFAEEGGTAIGTQNNYHFCGDGRLFSVLFLVGCGAVVFAVAVAYISLRLEARHLVLETEATTRASDNLAQRETLLKKAKDAIEERNKNRTLDGMSNLDPDHMKNVKIEMGYVSVGMVKVDKREQMEGKMDNLKEKFREMQKKMKPLKLEEMWKDERTKRILVVGEAGSGKTTLLKFVSQTDLWKQFKLKIYVALRLVKDKESLEDIVIFGALGGREDLRENVIVLLESLDPKETLWIMDGWDEISVEPESVLSEIQKGQHKLVEYMLAGSRPEAKLSVLCDSIVENQGFSEEGKTEYLKHYFAGNEKGLANVLELLKEPFLGEMCRNPLMLRLTCMAAGNVNITSKTQLYQIVIDRVLERFLEKEHIEVKERLKIAFEIRKALQKLAWTGFVKQNLVLSATELLEGSRELVGYLQRCGLLREERGSGQLFVWLHYTFQEYLAAEYACHQLENVGQALRELRKKLGEESDVFFGFVCGIGGNANARMREWFPFEFVDEELYFFAEYPQLGWMSEGNELVEKLFDERVTDNKKRVALLESAARFGQIGAVKYLLKRCDAKSDLSLPLWFAVERGRAEIVRLLLEDGRADPRANDNLAVRDAPKGGHPEVVKLVLHDEALRLASQYGRPEIVRLFLADKRVNVGAFGAVFEAYARRDIAAVVELLNGKTVDPTAFDNWLLRTASADGYIDIVWWLLKDGRADPTSRNSDALLSAAEREHVEIVRLLLEDGRADPLGPDLSLLPETETKKMLEDEIAKRKNKRSK